MISVGVVWRVAFATIDDFEDYAERHVIDTVRSRVARKQLIFSDGGLQVLYPRD